MNQININPKLTKKQKEALRILTNYENGITEVLYGGAAGGGKSFLGCLWLIVCALKYPESRWLMGRAQLSTLRKTTLKTFFEVTKKLGLKDSEHYKYNKLNNEIIFFNGSEIILKDLAYYPSDPDYDALGSLEIAGAFVDEANQITERAKNIVMSRIRHKLDEFGISPKMLMSCNPARNWVYNEYKKKLDDGRLEDYKCFIQALNTDNQFISRHYLTGLERQDEVTKRRLLHGEWDYEDELGLFKYDSILDMFQEEPYHFIQEDTKPKPILSIDVARLGKDKTCILVWNDLDIIEVKEISKKRLDEQKIIIDQMMNKYEIGVKELIFDTDGVGGGLADMYRGCLEIVNNSRPLYDENYQNLKTQLYYKLADTINTGKIRIFNVSADVKLRLTQELQVIKRVGADQDGKLKITNKEQIKNLISRSPDISDACAFRMYYLIKKKGGTDFSISFLEF